jgi:type IV secretion system protein VirB4
MLIIGPTGTGKSVHGNQIISLEQKYGGFTYIFDIGGSYESVVELYEEGSIASAKTAPV